MHLIDGCQVSVHVAREATPTRHFLSSSRHLRDEERNGDEQKERYQLCVSMLHDVHLSQSFSVGAHISEDNKNVFLALVGHELCRGEGKAGGDDTLNTEEEIIIIEQNMGSMIYIRWVIGNVQEQTDILHRTILFKILFKETSSLHIHLPERREGES